MHWRGSFILLSIVFFLQNAMAQTINIKVVQNNVTLQQLTATTEIEVYEVVKAYINNLQTGGYLAASADSVVITNTNAVAYIYKGKQYQWASLYTTDVAQKLLSTIGYNPKQFTNTPIEPKAMATLSAKIITYAENNGYPFAQVYLDSFTENKNGVQCKLVYNKGKFVTIDSIDIQGDADVSYAYIANTIGIKEGNVYNEALIKNISNRLTNIPFLQEEKPWTISFNNYKTILSLYLKEKNANTTDILVGLLPTNNIIGPRYFFTGDVKIGLHNAINFGEKLIFNWQNLQYRSPRLLIQADVPFLFNTPIGISTKFNYIKNDSSFRNINADLAALYQLSESKKIKMYYLYNSAAILTIDTAAIKATRALPSALDMRSDAFGLQLQIDAVTNLANPHSGYQLYANGNVGIRQILKNITIENLIETGTGNTFAYLYNSLPLRSNKYNVQLMGAYYTPITKAITLLTRASNALIYNPNLFKNEMFQIGGYNLLRGYNEASLFVQQYHVLAIEPRYSISNTSYLFAFADVGLLKGQYFNNKNWQQAIGTGAGISLKTKNGQFNLMYAIGDNLGAGFKFNNSKIHFGYGNSF